MQRKFTQKLINQKILLRKSEELNYCKDHNLLFTKLDNGINILAAQRSCPDLRESNVQFQFQTGSYFDPKGQEGIHHMLEHLFFSRKLKEISYQNNTSVNGTTSIEKIKVINSGLLNLDFLHFGLPVVLKKTIKSLQNPFGLNPKRIEREKAVILEEYNEFYAQHDNVVAAIYTNLICEEGNPLKKLPIGTPESIYKISYENLLDILNKNIIPQNLTVSIFSEGIKDEAKYLTETLQKSLTSCLRNGKKSRLKFQNFSKLSHLPTDKLIKIPTRLNNELSSLFLSWTLPVNLFSKEFFALNVLIEVLQNEFHNEVRELGMGYYPTLHREDLFPNKVHLAFMLNLSSDKAIKINHKLKLLIYRILRNLQKDPKKLKESLTRMKLAQKAVPIDQLSRLNSSINSLIKFERMMNNDVLEKIYLETELQHIQTSIKYLLEEPPVKTMIGDF